MYTRIGVPRLSGTWHKLEKLDTYTPARTDVYVTQRRCAERGGGGGSRFSQISICVCITSAASYTIPFRMKTIEHVRSIIPHRLTILFYMRFSVMESELFNEGKYHALEFFCYFSFIGRSFLSPDDLRYTIDVLLTKS